MTRPQPRSSPGFTLLELLLALSIAGLVAVSLFSSLSIAFRARRNAETALEPARQAGLAMQILREDLESALPPRGTLANAFYSTDATDTRGLDSDAVTFSAATPAPLHVTGTGDVKQVTLAVLTLRDSGQRVLVRRVQGNLLSPVLLDPDDEVLCRNVGSFNLRFFDGTLWWDSWDSALESDEVPVAVEVTLELEPPDASASAGSSAKAGSSTAPWPRFVRVIQLSCAGQGAPDEESTPSSDSTGSQTNNTSGTQGGPAGGRDMGRGSQGGSR